MLRVREAAVAVGVVLAALSCAHPSVNSAPSTPAAAPGAPAPRPRDPALSGKLPDVPLVHDPVALRVTYPGPEDVVDVRDSSFILGSAGTGDARLTINGAAVPVAPNGAWLAWLPFPHDSIMHFEIVAETPRDTARLTLSVRRAVRPPPPTVALWIDTASIAPRGRVWARRDEPLTVRVRASEGATLRLRLPGGAVVPLVPDPRGAAVPAGIRAFDHDTANLRTAPQLDRYVGVVRGAAVGAPPGPIVGAPDSSADSAGVADTAVALIEAVQGSDTARVRWPIRLALLDTLPIGVRFDDDTARRGTTDSLTIGRALPGGTYHWFFPTGTRATVLGRMNGDLRVRLAEGVDAWVPAADAQPYPPGTPLPRGVAGSITTHASALGASVRIPLGERVPFRIDETPGALALTIFSTVGDIDWTRYGGADSLIRRIAWHQAAADVVRLDVELGLPLWGYRARWDGTDLILDVRRPPAIDVGAPLRGRRIVVDAGHPPGGATGPTGLREAEANLGVALKLRDLLQAAGAEVIMTRSSDSSLELLPRTRLAERLDADLLLSIHNNALPDGVNPFTNNGTSVFYDHAPALPLARDVQRALVARLGLRDLGAARGDLALVRPTWMPAILCEGLYMIVPEQESALRSPEGQQLYAQGVFDGVERFLRDVAKER